MGNGRGEPVRLGRSGLWVSRLTLGTMTFGDRTDEAEARAIMARALDEGVFSFDTADNYAGGASEEIVGRFLRGASQDVVLATKLANPGGPGPNARGLSRRWIGRALEASLRRLGRDHVDILYLHKEDPGTPIAETARAVADLRRAGKLRYFGVSNWKAWRIATLAALCREEGVDGPVVSQPLYHMLNRTAEMEGIPVCTDLGMGVISYSPTARGVLTGKYRDLAAPPEGSRGALGNARMLQTEWSEETVRAAREVVGRAEAKGTTPVAYATAWVLANPRVTSAIAGPRTLAQFESYLPALDLVLDADDEGFADALVPPGTTARPGFTDPIYPVEGRASR